MATSAFLSGCKWQVSGTLALSCSFPDPRMARHYGLCRPHKWTASSKGRVPLMLVALLDVLRSFPGEVPNMDGVLSTADIPCVPKCA